MATPVLITVDEDAGSLAALDDTLRRRYDRDYLIVSEASPATALARLRDLQVAGNPVALVLAASGLTAVPATEFLAQARGMHPAAKRVLVVPRGGPAAPS